MQVQRHFAEVQSSKLTIDLPESFINHKVEVIVLTLDEEKPLRRSPHPDIAGKLKITGDIFNSAPETDWDLPG